MSNKSFSLGLLFLLMVVTPSAAQEWVGTWATAPESAAAANMPKNSKLADGSLRQTVRVSLGGQSMRIHFSNQFASSPIDIESVYVADATEGSEIDPSTARYLKFDGKEDVTIAPGKVVCSDPLEYPLNPLHRLSITINYGSRVPLTGATVHRGARTNSYIMEGKSSKPQNSFDTTEQITSWYTITAIDVPSTGQRSIAVLGNSITDGRGSTTDHNDRWTDAMADALDGQVGVLNLGIGGNSIITGGLGRPASERFDEDILSQSGITAVIIGGGINDVGGSKNAEKTSRQLIRAYENFISKSRGKGLQVFIATITPIGGTDYWSPFHEAVRQSVNDWIRSTDLVDGVIDFDQVVADPDHQPARVRIDYQYDALHPNPSGYKAMGQHAAEVVNQKQ